MGAAGLLRQWEKRNSPKMYPYASSHLLGISPVSACKHRSSEVKQTAAPDKHGDIRQSECLPLQMYQAFVVWSASSQLMLMFALDHYIDTSTAKHWRSSCTVCYCHIIGAVSLAGTAEQRGISVTAIKHTWCFSSGLVGTILWQLSPFVCCWWQNCGQAARAH